MSVTRWCRVPVFAVVLAPFACSDGGGTEPPGPPAQVLKSGGDNQAWYFDNPLPIPYEVRVTDAASRAVPGVVVAWAVMAGGGSLSAGQGFGLLAWLFFGAVLLARVLAGWSGRRAAIGTLLGFLCALAAIGGYLVRGLSAG